VNDVLHLIGCIITFSQAQTSQSFHPPHIKFDKSIWREDIYTPVDPDYHKVTVAHLRISKAGLDLTTHYSGGKHRYSFDSRRLREPNVKIKKYNKWGKVVGYLNRDKVDPGKEERDKKTEEWKKNIDKEWVDIDSLPDIASKQAEMFKVVTQKNEDALKKEKESMTEEDKEAEIKYAKKALKNATKKDAPKKEAPKKDDAKGKKK
jgi:hypothetical protein